MGQVQLSIPVGRSVGTRHSDRVTAFNRHVMTILSLRSAVRPTTIRSRVARNVARERPRTNSSAMFGSSIYNQSIFDKALHRHKTWALALRTKSFPGFVVLDSHDFRPLRLLRHARRPWTTRRRLPPSDFVKELRAALNVRSARRDARSTDRYTHS